MIFDKIEQYLRGEIQPTEERVAWAQALVQGAGSDSFRRNFIERMNGTNADGTKRNAVSASSHWYCSRHIYYDLIASPKEPPAPRAYLSFFLGDNCEDLILGLSVLAGVPVLFPQKDGKQLTVKRVMNGEEVFGHVDMVVEYEGEGVPVEIKSMPDFGWKKAKDEGVENTFGYVDQLQWYMDAMKAKAGFFVGVNKSTGHVFEQEVKRDLGAIQAIDYSHKVATAMADLKKVPDRPSWATTKRIAGCDQIDATRCSYCGHRAMCWPGYEMVVVGGSPKYRKPVDGSAVETKA